MSFIHTIQTSQLSARRSRLRNAVLLFTSVLTCLAAAAPVARAQDTLLAALKQKYRLTEINMEGVVAAPGTVLTIDADGINAEPYPTMITFENPVVDGHIKQRSKGLGFIKSTNLQILQPGQKVYVTKINSSEGKEDDLKVTILTCDPVMATFSSGAYGHYQAPKRYSTTLAFKLTRGALATMSVDDASKLIEGVLSFNAADQVRARYSGTVSRTCEPHCAVSATTGAVVGGAVVAPADAAPAPAAPTIVIGQTTDQVVGIMGQPKQIVDLGAKKIYLYPSMKIVFTDGKVGDVQ